MKKKAKTKKSKSYNRHSDSDGNIYDERFQKAQTHPQFKKRNHNNKKRGERHTANNNEVSKKSNESYSKESSEVDYRFNAIFTDSRFSFGDESVAVSENNSSNFDEKSSLTRKTEKKRTDKYGRIIQHKKKAKQRNLFEEGGKNNDKEKQIKKNDTTPIENDDDTPSTDRILNNTIDTKIETTSTMCPESRIAYLTALSRGEIDTSSSSDEGEGEDKGAIIEDRDSSSSDSTNLLEEEEHSIYGKTGVLDPSYQFSHNKNNNNNQSSSQYLAICNIDWSNIRAIDLLAIIKSFTKLGCVKVLQIYPSNYGLQQMKKDRTFGPPVNIWKEVKKSDSNDDSSDEDNKSLYDEREKENYINEDNIEKSENDKDLSKGDATTISTTNIPKDDNKCFMEEDDDDVIIQNSDELDSTITELKPTMTTSESDFNPEKLRAYEVSKMQYYFAIIEFTSSIHADKTYQILDGIEIGDTSIIFDFSYMTSQQVKEIRKEKKDLLFDEASIVPSNYKPNNFVVMAALQSSYVKCTWDEGNKEREEMLTQYGIGNDRWDAMANNDDLSAYLASDNSSGKDSDSEQDDDKYNTEKRNRKGSNLRKLLGLDVCNSSTCISSNDDENEEETIISTSSSDGDRKKDSKSCAVYVNHSLHADTSEAGANSYRKETEEVTGEMEFKFIPGKLSDLERKIRSKLKETKNNTKNKRKEKEREDLMPWGKYQLKRKEKRRLAREAKKNRKEEAIGEEVVDSGIENYDVKENGGSNDDKGKTSKQARVPSAKEELALLLAGNDDEEGEKDYDMKSLIRSDKNKKKKLRGSRKRKEEEFNTNVSGVHFEIDTKDERFAAVLEGNDSRFGIDKTNPLFKETPAMRKILNNQKKRKWTRDRKEIQYVGTKQDNIQKIIEISSIDGDAVTDVNANAMIRCDTFKSIRS